MQRVNHSSYWLCNRETYMESTTNNLELLTGSVTQRSKWDRGANKKLSKKVYVARMIFLDGTGKKRERTKEFLKKKDAEDHIRQECAKFERSNGREFEAEKMTFCDLADHYEKYYAKVAEYSDERKIGGLRSLAPVLGYLKVLREHFGKFKLTKINYGMLREYRDLRLKTPVTKTIKIKVPLTSEERKNLKTRKLFRTDYQESQRPRKIASVNRELTTLRHMLNIAETEGWIPKNPFRNGTGLIHVSAETMRQRILSREEEQRLLAVCNCDERRRLRAIIICLLDTGMRFSEVTTLTWNCVDFNMGVLNIKAFNTKTAKTKTVAITSRLRSELVRLWEARRPTEGANDVDPSDRVFGIRSNVKSSWTTARRLAGLEEVRLHDLRHTFGTRLNQLGLSQASIARSLGHQQLSTTYRYINADESLIESVRTALENFNEGSVP